MNKKNSFRIFCLLFLMFSINVMGTYAQNVEEKELKQPAYRLGTTDEPEARFKTVDTSVAVKNPVYAVTEKKQVGLYSYADSNLKMLSNEISQDVLAEREKMFSEISILWDGAVRKSETIKFAIYKLSNPEADKPDEKIVKKIITPLAGLTTLAGAGIGDPLISSGAFLGSSLMDIFSKNEKDLNYKYTKVNDTDMIVLVRKIDDLQKSIVNYYCDYVTNKNILQMEEEILLKRKKQYDNLQKGTKAELLIADSFYREAIERVAKAQSKFLASRAVLEQLVGFDSLKKFEDEYLNTD